MSYIQTTSVVILAAAARTLNAADSGKTFLVSKAAAYAISLPALAAGLSFRFVVRTGGANIVSITSTGVNIVGHAVVGPTAGATLISGAGSATIIFAVTSIVGDEINLVCDGTNWFASGITGANSAAAIGFV